jgi:phage-related protein
VDAWTIEFYETTAGQRPVQTYLDSLAGREAAAMTDGLQRLREQGLLLGLPYVRPLGQKLWELRVRAGRQHRVLHVATAGRRFLMLHAFTKKTPQTPRREIDLALRRLADHETRHLR